MLPSDAAMGDDVGHGERLARTCHAHQTLAMPTEIEPVGKPLDGFGLIALGRILAGQFESVHRAAGARPRASSNLVLSSGRIRFFSVRSSLIGHPPKARMLLTSLGFYKHVLPSQQACATTPGTVDSAFEFLVAIFFHVGNPALTQGWRRAWGLTGSATETLSLLMFATARSGTSSPARSSMAGGHLDARERHLLKSYWATVKRPFRVCPARYDKKKCLPIPSRRMRRSVISLAQRFTRQIVECRDFPDRPLMKNCHTAHSPIEHVLNDPTHRCPPRWRTPFVPRRQNQPATTPDPFSCPFPALFLQ